ncbi:hypothetical protein SAMN05428961_107304 [Paenibacillus sp. OK060]|nr:hypothetical protein SAMN05428961_107304 [Paenibacillus sp. OK060]
MSLSVNPEMNKAKRRAIRGSAFDLCVVGK